MEKRVKQKFGFWSIVLLAINGIIGTGIFMNPGAVIKTAGTWTPLIYVAAAVFASILAVTFASAAKYVNKNGAAYAYVKAAFGDDLGYYVGITRFFAAAIAWGVMGTAFVRSVLTIFFGSKAVTFASVTVGFIAFMLLLLGIVLSGTFITKIASNISTLGKVAALVLVVVGGIFIYFKTRENHFADVVTAQDAKGQLMVQPMTGSLFVASVISAFYAFTGFESVSTAASEMEAPEKNLPRAIPLAIGVITLIYVSVVSIAMLVDPVGIMKSDAPVRLADAFKNPVLRQLITYGALLSIFGINIAAAFSTPRVFDALSEERQVPAFLSRRNKRGVPVYAFLVTAAVAIIVPMSFGYKMDDIMVISSLARFVQFLFVPIAVIFFYKGRSKHEILPAKRNVVTDVWMPVLGFILSAFLLSRFEWGKYFSLNNVFALAAVVTGFLILPLLLYIPLKMGLYNKGETGQ